MSCAHARCDAGDGTTAGVLAPRRADRGRELARANERGTVDIVN